MKKWNLKKRLAAIAILPIAVSSTSVVIACGKHPHPADNSIQVVEAINITETYEVRILINSTKEELLSKITSDFMKNQLDEKKKEIFVSEKFKLNTVLKENDEELTDKDFLVVNTINAKINYNYGKFENQSTKLVINVIDERAKLNDVFKNFQFIDTVNQIAGFLENNNQEIITTQILKHISIENMKNAGLILKDHTNNSIVVEATKNSEVFQGKATLTWKLKLFEIWGYADYNDDENIENKVISDKIANGLRGYFYLEDNKVKYFDVRNSFKQEALIFHNELTKYHSFEFDDQEFIFKPENKSDEITEKVEVADISVKEGTIIKIKSPELDLIKIFKENNKDFTEFASREDQNIFVFELVKGTIERVEN